ncbi:MAG: lipopolysaccharide kinase InaA family protein, partial [Desulfobacteraceae bacterium]
NLNAPETIAICEKRYGPILVKEYAITLGVSGANDVYWWTNEKSDDRRTFAKALGSEIGRMHKADICHGDLRPGNVLAKQKDNGYEFVFIDNERTVQYKMLPWKFRKKNLVQINMLRPGTIGKKDRIIFFNSYMQHNTRIAAKKRLLATQVASETAERLKQSIKKAVP